MKTEQIKQYIPRMAEEADMIRINEIYNIALNTFTGAHNHKSNTLEQWHLCFNNTGK